MGTKRKKLAVLGGGMSAIATVYQLTSEPDWQEKWDITLYQLGWRIGGKGASGVNAEHNNRVQEHGLHIWFGFYENAFRVMRDCYEKLGRKPTVPMATLDDAFKKKSLVVLQEKVGDEWIPWAIEFPENNEKPGTSTSIKLSPWDYIQMIVEFITDYVDSSPHLKDESKDSGIKGFFENVWDKLEHLGEVSALAIAALIQQLLSKLSSKPETDELKPLSALLKKLTSRIGKKLDSAEGKEVSVELRRLYSLVNLSYAIINGIIHDFHDLHKDGWDVINDQDFKEWLGKHGATETTLDSQMVNLPYYSTFSEGTRVAAGSYLYALLRALATYKGAYSYKMQAGMGDIVFGPFYEVLKRRGVRFEFFHRVDALRLSEDKKNIAAIDMFRQVSLVGGDKAVYEPLVNVKDLPSWPSEPIWNQIKKPKQYKNINLESYEGNPHEKPRTLKHGEDFDVVLYGISAGALPTICKELIEDENNPKFKKMADSARPTKTAGMQLWLKPGLEQLGWEYGSPFMQLYARVYNAWLDASQVLIREDWANLPVEEQPGSLAYFSGALNEDEDAVDMAMKWLNQNVGPIWPKATPSENSNAIDWSLLVDTKGGKGPERFKSQYVAEIPNPSDLYIRLPPENAVLRLSQDESGYENMVLVGDWTKNPVNLASIEGSTMAGLRAANALLGKKDLNDGIVH